MTPKRLSHDELEALFEDVPAAIHIKDLDGRYLMANRAVRRNLAGPGRPAGSLLGTTVFEHVPAEVADRIAESDRRVIETLEPVELEVPFTAPGEPDRWYLSVRFPLLDGAGVLCGTGGVAIDVTDRVSARQEAARLTEQLAATVRELDAFAYSVSHDLRAPLRGMNGFSQILLDRYADRLDETGRDYLHRIRAAGERMTRMIDDLLALSRLGRTDPVPETVDVTRMAHELVDELLEGTPARPVQVSIADGLTAWADPGLLRIALRNLLSNAWKFTTGRDGAHIEVGAGPRNDRHGELFVRDNGAGFDMAYADKLFSPFQRLHDAAEFPGNGIGLATAQRAIIRQGGRIRATAIPDQGATFTITLNLPADRWGESTCPAP